MKLVGFILRNWGLLSSVSLDISIDAFSVNNCSCFLGTRVDIGIEVTATPSDVQTIRARVENTTWPGWEFVKYIKRY